MDKPVTIDAIKAAHKRIKNDIVCTPLLRAPLANAHLGLDLQVKAEALQITGAFKYRGARNMIMRNKPKSVVAYSSGNHGQAVAAVASMVGIKATIVMPEDTPGVKREGVAKFGATIVTYDRLSEDRMQIAKAIATRNGAVLVPPYEHPDIIMGQATAGLEIIAQTKTPPDVIIVPVGGGGLSAGIFYVMRHFYPKARLIGVEPKGYDDTRQSLANGEITAIGLGEKTLCDALMVPQPGAMTFALNRHQIDEILCVNDAQVLHAMAFLFRYYRIVAEPGGAVALAAILANAPRFQNKNIVAVVSGGNVDKEIFAKALDFS